MSLVERELPADVDDQRAVGLATLDLGRAELVRARMLASSGPRLIATIALKFGGCGPRPAVVRRTNTSASEICSSSLWRDSNAIVELIFMFIPGPPHIDPPR